MEAGTLLRGHGSNLVEPCGSSERAMIGDVVWSDSEGFCNYYITMLSTCFISKLGDRKRAGKHVQVNVCGQQL